MQYVVIRIIYIEAVNPNNNHDRNYKVTQCITHVKIKNPPTKEKQEGGS